MSRPEPSPSSSAERGLLDRSRVTAPVGRPEPVPAGVASPSHDPTMHPSIFNVRVPLPDGSVFLMNTLTDAQLAVTPDVVELIDDLGAGRVRPDSLDAEARSVVGTLSEQGFLTSGPVADRRALEERFELLPCWPR